MDVIITLIAAITLTYITLTLMELYVGFRSIINLRNNPLLATDNLPSVSIIISALNEEEHITDTITALLKIDYPLFEIIIINDRSNDNTASILNTLQQQYPQLKVKHIHKLPQGWFGKNHALYQGSQLASGDWLLFTDADVTMKPDTIKHAISYALQHQLQHLTFLELHVRNTFAVKILLLAQYFLMSFTIKPWRIRYTWSKKSLGYGAFNLVEKSAYENAGTHQAIKLECLDDLKLGALLKNSGFKQDTVNGMDFIERQWYANLPAMIHGLQKNSFAYFNYNFAHLIAATILAFTFFIWPTIAIFCTSGPGQSLNVLNVCLLTFAAAYVCTQFRLPKKFAVLYPASILLLLYTIWNSALVTYKQNGVIWRDTFYPLDDLKQN